MTVRYYSPRPAGPCRSEKLPISTAPLDERTCVANSARLLLFVDVSGFQGLKPRNDYAVGGGFVGSLRKADKKERVLAAAPLTWPLESVDAANAPQSRVLRSSNTFRHVHI